MAEGDAVRADLAAGGSELLLTVCPRTSRLEELSDLFFSPESWCRLEVSSRRSVLREEWESLVEDEVRDLEGAEVVVA